MICPHSSECGGCSLWGTPYTQQLEEKSRRLQALAAEMDFGGAVVSHSLGGTQIRDRADLQWRLGQGWGFFSKHFGSIKPIDACPLFTPALAELFSWWSQFKLKAEKASVRLRVCPKGSWGVWLDLANLEIKNLLQEDELLTAMVARSHVEIGQKSKVLRKVGDQWKLLDPEKKPWFETTDLRLQKFPLFGSVSSFTQAGHAINKVLVQTVLKKALGQSIRKVVELGAGAGNFTVALASEGFQVRALEQQESALAGLLQTLTLHPELKTKIQTQVGNFQKINWGNWSEEPSLLLLDPPKSGVGENLIAQIRDGNFPVILYVACGLDSWLLDGRRLRQLGYTLSDLEWVDQFPNTELFEIISVWQKNG